MSKWMALLREPKNSVSLTPEPTKPTKPTKGGSVGFVGSSPWTVEKIDVPSAETRQHDAHVSDWVDWNERAAIMEYDGGLMRVEAETVASEHRRAGRNLRSFGAQRRHSIRASPTAGSGP
jgi:hypothetical protein